MNELTKRLYAAGWTREHHPDYVYWSDWQNLGYKFEYACKVNIFYDVRRTFITREGMFEETRTEITKGNKVFPHPVARTDAEIWLATKKAEFDPIRDKHIINPARIISDVIILFYPFHYAAFGKYSRSS